MKKKRIPEIPFQNQENPVSPFDVVKLEDLFKKGLDHDIERNHSVKFYIIFFVYEGEGIHTIDFVDYEYKAGTVLLIRKDQIHKFWRNSNVKGYLLVFKEEFIVGHLNKMEAAKTMQLFNESLSFPKIIFNSQEEFSDFTILIKHLESEYYAKDDFSIGITRSVLHIVITKLFRIKSKAGYFVEKKKYISQFLEFQNLVESECLHNRKVAHYASQMSISTKTLNNVVNHIVNTSAKVFIDEIAILHIKRLLINTQHSIKEIAYLAGFSDPTNFFKFFKKYSKTSPKLFRETHNSAFPF